MSFFLPPASLPPGPRLTRRDTFTAIAALTAPRCGHKVRASPRGLITIVLIGIGLVTLVLLIWG